MGVLKTMADKALDTAILTGIQQTIAISGVMLRASGNDAIVELEIAGKWHKIIACDMRGSFSHIVEPLGIQHCIETGTPKSS
jgi:hypothetical protein